MLERIGLALAWAASFVVCAAVDAQTRAPSVLDAPGSVVIEESLAGTTVRSYLVDAQRGQTLNVSLDAQDDGTHFSLFEPGANQAIFIGSLSGRTLVQVITTAGEHEVRVYRLGVPADPAAASPFTLSLSLEEPLPPPIAGLTDDVADSLSGGPDEWEVSGLSAGSSLNLRAGPSGDATILASLADGTRLRNLGCRLEAGRRWCEVERLDGSPMKGWVSGDYLREPTAATGGGDDLAGAAGFDATGEIVCVQSRTAATGRCPFGVVRGEGGRSVLTVFRDDGSTRVLHFAGSEPVMVEGDHGALRSSRFESTIFVEIGRGERYEIAEAILLGG